MDDCLFEEEGGKDLSRFEGGNGDKKYKTVNNGQTRFK